MKKFNGLKVNDLVHANGHDGYVVRLCEWSNSMIEVKLPGGLTCVDSSTVAKGHARADFETPTAAIFRVDSRTYEICEGGSDTFNEARAELASILEDEADRMRTQLKAIDAKAARLRVPV